MSQPGRIAPNVDWGWLHRFWRFYLTTSLAYDGFRSVGNVVLVVLTGPALLLALSRFRRRFEMEVVTQPG